MGTSLKSCSIVSTLVFFPPRDLPPCFLGQAQWSRCLGHQHRQCLLLVGLGWRELSYLQPCCQLSLVIASHLLLVQRPQAPRPDAAFVQWYKTVVLAVAHLLWRSKVAFFHHLLVWVEGSCPICGLVASYLWLLLVWRPQAPHSYAAFVQQYKTVVVLAAVHSLWRSKVALFHYSLLCSKGVVLFAALLPVVFGDCWLPIAQSSQAPHPYAAFVQWYKTVVLPWCIHCGEARLLCSITHCFGWRELSYSWHCCQLSLVIVSCLLLEVLKHLINMQLLCNGIRQ